MSISETELTQFELDSKRDDLFDVIVPSDVRRMLAEIRRLQSAKTEQPVQEPPDGWHFEAITGKDLAIIRDAYGDDRGIQVAKSIVKLAQENDTLRAKQPERVSRRGK